MKRTKIIALLSICLAMAQAPNLASAESNNPPTNDYEVIFESDQISCFHTLGYIVIQRNVESGVGNDFLVKYKTNPGDTTPCTYSPEVGDFEIKDEWAAYFADLKNDRLYLEHYTGPGPYTFSIWNLIKRQKMYESFGSNVDYQEDSVIYWKETSKATTDNCTKIAEWESHGLGGVIETKVTLSLSDFTTTLTNETRCSPRQ